MVRKSTRRPARKYKRRGIRKGGQRTTLINTSLQPIPSRYLCKMKYVDALNDVGGSPFLGYGNFQFLVNSLFDPNASGGGHQPYGYDTLSSLYNRYRVISCRYAITGIVLAGGTGVDGIIGVVNSNEGLNANTGGISEFQENPRSKFITQYVGNEKKLTGNINMAAVTGRSLAQYMADDRYQALTTANPQESIVMNLFFGRMDGLSGATVTADLNVTLEFVVEFFDVKPLARSS